MSLDDLRQELARRFKLGRFKNKRSWNTLWRWTAKLKQKNGHGEMVDVGGVLNRSTGERVYLESIRIGGSTHSSVEAYLRFVARCSEGSQ